MIVKHVEGNVKGQVAANLGERTLIVGKNASGKSRVVQAIELALSGAASDVAGRAVLKAAAELQMLTPPGETRLWARVVLDNGEPATFEAVAGKTAKRIGLEGYFPLRDVREALLGSVETARKAILRWAGAGDWIDLAKRTIAPVLWERLVALRTPDLPVAIEEAKRRARDAKATTDAESDLVKRLSGGLAAPPTEIALGAMRTRLEIARQAEKARGFSGLAKTRDDVGRSLDGAQVQAEELRATVTKLRAVIPKTPAVPTIFKVAMEVIRHLAESEAESCAICGQAASPEVFKTRLARAEQKIQAAINAEAEAHAQGARLREAEADLAMAERDVLRFQAAVDQLSAAMADAPAMPELVPEESVLLLENMLRSAETAAREWASIQAHRARALDAEREMREWKDLAEALSGVLGTQVEQARIAFEAKVQKFLPTGWRFGIDLLDGDREVLRVGLRSREGREIVQAALSGAEWATVTAALAMAIVGDQRPAIIIPEERAFDPETLTSVLQAFSIAGKAQVIVTSPVAPAMVPKGWTVIRTDATAEEKPKPKEKEKEKPKESTPKKPVEIPKGPNFCPDCTATIAKGKCQHGIGPGNLDAAHLFD